MNVTIEPIYYTDAIGGKNKHAIARVFIQHDALKTRNDEGRINIGSIGIQEGANFLPNSEFYEVLGPANRDQVVAEIKKQHGSASPEPHTDLPPPLPPQLMRRSSG